MTEMTQIVIIAVVTILTVVLSAVGYELFMLLKEVRESVKKTNSILYSVESVTTKISNTTESMTGMFEGLQAVIGLVSALRKSKHKQDE